VEEEIQGTSSEGSNNQEQPAGQRQRSTTEGTIHYSMFNHYNNNSCFKPNLLPSVNGLCRLSLSPNSVFYPFLRGLKTPPVEGKADTPLTQRTVTRTVLLCRVSVLWLLSLITFSLSVCYHSPSASAYPAVLLQASRMYLSCFDSKS
jgi:hypothetical protein